MWTSPEPFKRQLPSKRSEMLYVLKCGPDNFLSDLIKVCPFIPLKSLSEITVKSAPVSILKLSSLLLIQNFFV
jgi:hypothetical protein